MASIEVLHPRERLLNTARDYAVALTGKWRPRSAMAASSTVLRVAPQTYRPGGAPLADLASRRVDTSLHQASRRVCRAMLLLAPLRDSQDPELRAAYENIHDVMGDLASIHHWNALAALRPLESETVSED